MANLFDIVNKNRGSLLRGPGGSLTQESPASLQELASQFGVQAPTSATTAASLPLVTAKQAQMAGSPQAQTAALKLASVEPSQSLQTTERRGAAPQAASTAQQQQIQQVKQAGALSSVPERVSQYIENARQQLLAQATAPAVSQQVVGPEGADIVAPPGTDLSALKSKLATLRTNPNNIQLLAEINTSLGRASNSLLTPEQLESMYQSTTDAIAAGAAGSIDQDLTVSDLAAQPAFGMSLDSLANLLGKSTSEVGAMSLADLQAATAALAQPAQVEVAQQQAGASAMDLGGAERAAYRALGREQAESGVASAVSDLSGLVDSISKADTVQFGGQFRTVAEVLGDEGISQAIRDYLGAPEGSPIRAQLEQTEPELVKFIQANAAALAQVSGVSREAVSQLASIAASRASMAKFGQVTVNDAVMSKLVPGWGTVSASGIDASKSPVLSLLSEVSPAEATSIGTVLNSLGEQYPELLGELSQLTREEARAILTPDKLNELSQAKSEAAKVANWSADPVANAKAIATELLGAGVDLSNLQGLLDKLNRNQQLGLGSDPRIGLLDANSDGRVDSPDQMLHTIQAGTTEQPTLRGLALGELQDYQAPAAPVRALDKSQQLLVDVADKLQQVVPGWQLGKPISLKQMKLVGLDLDSLFELDRQGVAEENLGHAIKIALQDRAVEATKQKLPAGLLSRDGQRVLRGPVLSNYIDTSERHLPTAQRLQSLDSKIQELSRQAGDAAAILTAAKATNTAAKVDATMIQQSIRNVFDEVDRLRTARQQIIEQRDRIQAARKIVSGK